MPSSLFRQVYNCQRSSEAEAYRRWYKTARWQARRAQQLRDEPLCRTCAKAGRTIPATVADHVTPHHGDEALFWEGELQSLCDAKPWRCHSSRKQSEEKRGYSGEVDVDGWPIDPAHPTNRQRSFPPMST